MTDTKSMVMGNNTLQAERSITSVAAPETSSMPTDWFGSSRSAYTRFLKPVTDVLGGLTLALVLLPVMLTIALMIRIKLGGPILLRQDRVGVNGKPFQLLKFRTMHPDRRSPDSEGDATAEFTGKDRRRVHKTVSDPRHTNIGRRLRKYGFDELPQLWNIVRGQMSLIGPRPELLNVVDAQYGPGDNRRHLVKPGLTGLWQVTKRGEGELMYQDIAIDLEYVDTISLKTDMSIALATVRNVLTKSQLGS